MVAFICIIAAAVSLDDLDSDNFDELDDIGEANNEDWNWEGTASLARSACGFLIFVAIMVMILEGAIIAQRFLNFGIVEKFNLIFIIVVGVAVVSTHCTSELHVLHILFICFVTFLLFFFTPHPSPSPPLLRIWPSVEFLPSSSSALAFQLLCMLDGLVSGSLRQEI